MINETQPNIPTNAESSTQEVMSTGLMQDGADSSVIRYLLDHNFPLAYFSEYLSGEVYDESERSWKAVGRPLINQEGRRRVMQEMYIHCNHMFETAKVEQELIAMLTRDFGREMMMILEINQEKYQLEESDIIPIVKTMTRCVHFTFKKSQGGNMQDFLRNNFKMVEHQTAKKGGLFSGGMFKNN